MMTRTDAEQELHRERTAPLVFTLRCTCGLVEEREVVDGQPEPCSLCDDDQNWARA